MSKRVININCDMGEGLETDSAIMPFISACSIACGGHFGDKDTMSRTIELALQHGVSIGAHPSYPDKEHFGRRQQHFEYHYLRDSLLEQLHQLETIARSYGVTLSHIKAHGALYNISAVDPTYAQLMIEVVHTFSAKTSLFVLSGSLLSDLAEQAGLSCLHETFIDRHYLSSGQLVPRSKDNAIIDDIPTICQRTLAMVIKQEVQSVEGTPLVLQCDTCCIHGDHPKAVDIARNVYNTLKQYVGIE